MTDGYQQSAEFLHLLSEPAWQLLRAPVREALHTSRQLSAPVTDIGAGTGLGTAVLADAFPSAQVLAVEPSPALRAVLLSRVASTPDLRNRVTVVAGDALGTDLPDRLGAVLAMNMIGHLDPVQRRAFWQRIALRIEPGAPLVVNLQPPTEPVAVPHATFGAVQVGQYTYEGGGHAEPTGPDTVTWRMRYRVLDPDGMTIRESRVDYRWHVLSMSNLLGELADAGLAGEVGPSDVVRAARSD